MDRRSLAAVLLLVLSSDLVQLVSADLPLENLFAGQPAPPNTYSYQVSIQVNGKHRCGGSLIGDDLVLTAAHCFFNSTIYEYYPLDYKVIAGSVDLKQPQLYPAVDVAYILGHKNYIKQKIGKNLIVLNDIAVLKLKLKFPIGGYTGISVISIPAKGATFEGAYGVVTGYGANKLKPNPNSTSSSDVNEFVSDDKLYSLVHTILNSDKCDQGDHHICGDPLIKFQYILPYSYHAGTCRGDSGGPLAIFPINAPPVVVGIVSYGPANCDTAGSLGHFTEVSYYFDWIINAINNLPNAADTLVSDVASFLTK